MSDNFATVIQLLTQHWKLILFTVFALSIAIQLFYYLFMYLRVALHKHKMTVDSHEPVSVVICARDEEQNLIDNIPLWIKQDYAHYETFIILDACSDGSLDLMKNLVAEYPNLRYTIITKDAKFSHGKKLALTIGIKGAKHSVLLLTDADCAPSSEKWLHRLTSPLAQGYEIVLGYGKFQPKKTFLNRLIRYDAFFIAQQYLGTALMGIPYMGVGRNLAYKKEVYVRQGGFSKHAHIESGDDDLLINAAANKSNCTIEIHPDAHTISKAPETFKRWKHQKSRHLKASALYKKSHKIILALEPLSRILVWLAPIPLFFYHEWQMLALALSLSRFTIFMTVSKLNMRKLHEKGLWILSPLFDIVLPFLTLSFLIKSRLRKKTTVWK